MNKLLKDVLTFHKTYNQPILENPTIPDYERSELRVNLIEEELDELKQAIAENDIVGVADALTDLLYVVNGAVIEFGLKDYIEKCHAEVQASNMSKLGADGKPIYREDGKVVKGPNYFEPDLASIVNRPRFRPFSDLNKFNHFKFEGIEYFKIDDRRAVTQEANVSDRSYFEFLPNTKIEVTI